MTSGNFRSHDVASIIVDRADRQRRELRNIDELAESIQRIGLINPIVITSDGVLVAGERRLTAIRQLAWTHVPVQYAEDLSDYELQTIELEENIKRENLPWQDEVAALARFHALKASHEPSWSQEDTAAAVGLSQPEVSKKLLVAAQMGNEVIAGADRFSAALNIVQRNAERKKTSVLDSIGIAVDTAILTPEEQAAAPPPEPSIPLLNVSFHDWQETYDGPKFNLIHCDFPYGINVADSPRMDATIKDHYEDSPDIYWALLDRLALAMDNVVAESAHLIFWHSMKMNRHGETVDRLEAMGWKCNPFPLIWYKSDGSGIAPDPQRGPRQVYEAAIFASRGDRKITQEGCVANAFAYPGRRDGAIHASEKPYAMLRHFMRMVCDEYSMVLDPTCGSGNALKVAEDLKAAHVLGLEQLPEFYDITRDNWSKRGD
jgi:ParB family chromosome partitioning protein